MKWLIGSLLVVSAAVAYPAHAAGLGGSLGGSNGSGEFSDNSAEFSVSSDEVSVAFDTLRFGEVVDYRMTLGYLYGTAQVGSGSQSFEEDVDGYLMSNTVRCSVNPGRRVVFWVGPSLYLGNLKFKDSKKDGNVSGWGPSAGLNIGIGPSKQLTHVIFVELEGRILNLDIEFGGTYADPEVRDVALRAGVLFGL